jgi:hypothetical protein
MFNYRIGVFGALAVAVASIGSAQATSFHPAPASALAGLTITAGYIDTLYSDQFNVDPGSGGDAVVLNYINANFSGGLVQVGTSLQSICGGGLTTCTGSPNGGSFSGSANVFGIHIGGGAGGGIFYAFQYASAITNFSISGFSNGVSFIRGYCSLDNCTPNNPGPEPGQTPIPGAAFLMGSVLAGGAGFGAWRRRRREKFAA